MSRRRKAEKRPVEPDHKYGNTEVTKFIRKVMLDGKKSLATKIVYEAIDKFTQRVNAQGNELDAFLKALENATPHVEVKSRRIGGATYQVPIEILPGRKLSLAMKWVIGYAKAKAGRSMIDGLAQELQDCYNSQGSSVKKRDEVHRMAEANKAFAHYKW
jgi:small subunit ribosomal protein S7